MTLRAFFIPNFVRNDVKLTRQADATRVTKAEPKGDTMKREDITKLFPEATKEQIDELMSLNGADINAAKSGVDQLKAQHAAALKEATDKADDLQRQLDRLTEANTLRDLRDKVAKETGVPADLLTGATEEEFKTRAQALLDFKGKEPNNPPFKDGGEPSGKVGGGSTRDQFKEWFNETVK